MLPCCGPQASLPFVASPGVLSTQHADRVAGLLMLGLRAPRNAQVDAVKLLDAQAHKWPLLPRSLMKVSRRASQISEQGTVQGLEGWEVWFTGGHGCRRWLRGRKHHGRQGPTTTASPGNLVEMQITRPTPDLRQQTLFAWALGVCILAGSPADFRCSLQFENNGFVALQAVERTLAFSVCEVGSHWRASSIGLVRQSLS